jgi:hypothetical protein
MSGTPVASDYFRWGTQSRKLYDRLVCGPVTDAEIVRQLKIHKYNTKISEIRSRIAGTGVTVKAKPIDGRRRGRLIWEFRLALENTETASARRNFNHPERTQQE